MCRSLKRNFLGLQKFLSSTAAIPTDFYSHKLWGLIFLALISCSGGPDVRLGPFSPEISLLIFMCHMWVGDHPVLPCCLSFQSWCVFFFNSIVVGLQFSSISGGSEEQLCCSLVVMLMWLCEEVSKVYLLFHLDWKCQEWLLMSAAYLLPWILSRVVSAACCRKGRNL